MMDTNLAVFHFDEDRPSFETYCRDNGFRHWLASELKDWLGYASMQPVLNAVNKAMAACAQLNIPIPDNFEDARSPTGGCDWKLSRFACYLTVMNGDPKNQRVAQAQAYFITIADAFRRYVQESEGVERVLVRGEVSEREKALSATVHLRGVENFAFFQNAGYRGMYKRVPTRRSPLDFMGKTELAANLFRITQTEEKIRNEDLMGQRRLERAAEHVGREVRSTMIRLSGTPPEALPPATYINEVRRGLKRTGREFAKLDGPKKQS